MGSFLPTAVSPPLLSPANRPVNPSEKLLMFSLGTADLNRDTIKFPSKTQPNVLEKWEEVYLLGSSKVCVCVFGKMVEKTAFRSNHDLATA